MGLHVYADEALTAEGQELERLLMTDATDEPTYKTYKSNVLATYGSIQGIYRYNETNFTQLTEGLDYTVDLTVCSIILTTALTATEHLVLTPPSRISLSLGGNIGVTTDTERLLYVAKSGEFSYANVHITSERMEVQAPLRLETAGITFAIEGGYSVGSGFVGLVPVDVIGAAVFVQGAFIGKVSAATATTITTDNTIYVASNVIAQVIEIGDLLFAPDNAGVPGAYSSVVSLGNLTNSMPVPVWIKTSVTIGSVPIKSIEDAILLLGTEYI